MRTWDPADAGRPRAGGRRAALIDVEVPGHPAADSVVVVTGRADLRLGITDVAPVVACGAFSARAVVGEHLPITATVFREGHDAVAANVVWSPPAAPGKRATRPPLLRMERFGPEPDRWTATVVADREGLWTYQIEAWDDPIGTWHHAVEVKVEAGQGAGELANDLEEGARLLDAVGPTVPRERRAEVAAAAVALRDESLDLTARLTPALAAPMQELLHAHPVRRLVTRSPRYEVWVDRVTALYGSWYEFFPRSEGPVVDGRPTHGTFADAAKRLPAIAEMGFDVVYLPPIHPIGRVNRKGKNNTLVTEEGDVGSPWAIGSAEGGHDAVHPELGTMADFKAFVARTRELGMEVALDFALQAAPDHPWVTSHPEWFTTKPDGTIAYAENPPKKYQDIYPINFDNDPDGIYAECLRVLRVWIDGRGQGLPGRQPAHQGAELLALADLGGQEDRPGRAVPGRGLHPAGDDAPAGPGRVHPELHLLHLAHREVGDRGVRPRAGRHRALHAAQLLRQHPGHPARVAAVRRPADVQDPGRAGLDDEPDVGGLLRLRAVRARRAQARAARSTWTPRSSSCARATTPAPRPPAGRWRPT